MRKGSGGTGQGGKRLLLPGERRGAGGGSAVSREGGQNRPHQRSIPFLLSAVSPAGLTSKLPWDSETTTTNTSHTRWASLALHLCCH